MQSSSSCSSRSSRGRQCPFPCLVPGPTLAAFLCCLLLSAAGRASAWPQGSIRKLCAALQPPPAAEAPPAAALPPHMQCDPSYSWFLPERNQRLGIAYQGDTSRLRATMHRLLYQGGNLTVGFIGGSITEGAYPMEHSNSSKPWPQWTMQLLAAHLDPITQQRVFSMNGAIAATTPVFHAMCHQRRLTQDIDVVFVEFAWNDPGPPHNSLERLLRKLLKYPHSPAVVMMNTYTWFSGPCSHDQPPGVHWGSTHNNDGGYDKEFTTVAQHSLLPVLSVRACCHSLMSRGVEGFKVARPVRVPNCWAKQEEVDKPEELSLAPHVFYEDGGHPGGMTGARAMGEMAAALLLDAAVGLVHEPLGAEDAAAIQEDLPSPYYPGNYEHQSNTCFLWNDVHNMTQSSQGWVWTEEGRHKWGWVSSTPGAVLALKVPVMLPHDSLRTSPDAKVTLHINYLHSYEKMGKAEVQCMSGCICDPMTIDAWGEEPRHSQTHSAAMKVTESPECVLHITVQEETSDPGGGHKFKMVGLTISEDHEQVMHAADVSKTEKQGVTGRSVERSGL